MARPLWSSTYALLLLTATGCSVLTSLDDLGARDAGGGTFEASADVRPEASSPDAGVDAAPEAAAPETPVKGVVIDELGSPVAGVFVAIGASSGATAADGSFSFTAPPTYDAMVAAPTAETVSGKILRRFVGLSTRTPSLEIPAAKRTVAATYNVTGASFPLASNERMYVIYAPTPKLSGFDSTSISSASSVSTTRWLGASTSAGVATAYDVVIDALGFPQTWKSSATANFSFVDFGTSSLAVPLAAGVQTFPFAGTIDYGPSTGARLAFATFGKQGSSRILFQGKSPSPTSLTFQVPVQGVTGLAAQAGTASGAVIGWKQGVTTFSAAVTLPAGDLALVTPTSGATAIDPTSTFTWSATPSSLYLFDFWCGAVPHVFEAQVVTTRTSVTIPSSSVLGVTLPTGTSCSWNVFATGPLTNVDEAAGPAGFSRRMSFEYGSSDGFGFISTSKNVTTK